MLAAWEEHNTVRLTKREGGGFIVGLEQTPIEGERITAELAAICGMDPDAFIEKILGEVLTEMGGRWKPLKRAEPVKVREDRKEIAQLRAENAELMRRAGL